MRKFSTKMALVVMGVSLLIAYLIYTFVLGHPSNFADGNPAGEPVEGNYLGFIYKGGVVVIIIMAMQLVLLTYIVERFMAFAKASGKKDSHNFVKEIKHNLDDGDIGEAVEQCDEQEGSVANVLKNGLQAYRDLKQNGRLSREQKLATLKNDIDELAQLEIPVLERNLPIISTIASVATLVGLLGTVIGMIAAFAALANIGAPDAVGLANGISQALVTTALGIGTAAVAIVFYNYFAHRLDNITDAIEEGSYTLIQHFKKTHPEAAQKEVSHG